MIKYLKFFLIAILVLAAFAVRLYKINNPIADWHSWRQADTAAVARNFVKSGFTPFVPRYDDLSNVQSGKENPQGYRMVEFPLYQSISFVLYKVFGHFTLEVWLRLVSIISSIFSAIILCLLVAKYIGKKEGWAVFFVFSFLPYSVYYSRAILPEMLGVFLSLLALYLFDIVNDKKPGKSWLSLYLISAICAALALLVKPTMAFLLVPFVFLFWKNKEKYWGWEFFYALGFILVTAAPLFAWRAWISQFPEGIPASEWLFNGGNIRFTGAFFRWLLAERLSKLILGYGGLLFFFSGLARREVKGSKFFLFFAIGAALYAIIFARGNIQHDYYQIIWLPMIAIFTGNGMVFFLTQMRQLCTVPKTIFIFLLATAMMFSFSWYEIRGYYWVNHPEIVEAGKRVDLLTPKDAKVIAPYVGDTAFLYQTNRQGWPAVTKPIPEMVKMGADYLVIVNPDQDAMNLQKSYKIVERGEKYVIFDIKHSS